MALEFFNYSPDDIDVILGSIEVMGYGPDTFVNASREVQTFTKQVGADGMVTRTRSLNKSGQVTITLVNASPTNARFSALHNLDEETGRFAKPLMIKDRNGTTLLTAANAWLVKPADFERGRESGECQWIIEVDRLVGTLGGQLR